MSKPLYKAETGGKEWREGADHGEWVEKKKKKIAKKMGKIKLKYGK